MSANMVFQERMKERRTALHLTLAQVAEKMGVKEATIQRYESGEIKNVKHDAVVKLAEIFGCSPQYLMGWDESILPVVSQDSLEIIGGAKTYMRPVYSSISAGFGAYADDNIIGYMPAIIENPYNAENSIWIKVSGDSMSPKIEDGDYVLVYKQSSVESGTIAAVLVDGEEAYVKKIMRSYGRVELHSVNQYYPVRVYEGSETKRVKILGIVKQVTKKL